MADMEAYLAAAEAEGIPERPRVSETNLHQTTAKGPHVAASKYEGLQKCSAGPETDMHQETVALVEENLTNEDILCRPDPSQNLENHLTARLLELSIDLEQLYEGIGVLYRDALEKELDLNVSINRATAQFNSHLEGQITQARQKTANCSRDLQYNLVLLLGLQNHEETLKSRLKEALEHEMALRQTNQDLRQRFQRAASILQQMTKGVSFTPAVPTNKWSVNVADKAFTMDHLSMEMRLSPGSLESSSSAEESPEGIHNQ